MYTFGPLIAKNSRSGRLLGGAPVTVTTLDGVTLTTTPTPLVTNHEGYLPAFTVDTDQVAVMARPRGGDPLPLYAHEGIQDAAEAADTINTGRLSEDSLKSTIATETDRIVPGKVAEAIAADDTVAQAAAAAAGPAVAQALDQAGITVDTSAGTRVFVGGVMVHGDTGWRQIGPGQIIRRVGATVHLHLDLTLEDALMIVSIPSEMRPDGSAVYPRPLLHTVATPSSPVRAYMGSGNTELRAQAAVGDRLGGVATWTTANPWPTTLPGTPA